jgi:hypothetical protein
VAFLQFFQAIRKDIGSDFFRGILKISEVSLTEENKITTSAARASSPVRVAPGGADQKELAD